MNSNIQRNQIQYYDKCLFLSQKACKNCRKYSSLSLIQEEFTCYFCTECLVWTSWNHNTLLSKIKILPSTIELLLHLFIENKTVKEASQDLNSTLSQHYVSENTIAKYFKFFSPNSIKILPR